MAISLLLAETPESEKGFRDGSLFMTAGKTTETPTWAGCGEWTLRRRAAVEHRALNLVVFHFKVAMAESLRQHELGFVAKRSYQI